MKYIILFGTGLIAACVSGGVIGLICSAIPSLRSENTLVTVIRVGVTFTAVGFAVISTCRYVSRTYDGHKATARELDMQFFLSRSEWGANWKNPLASFGLLVTCSLITAFVAINVLEGDALAMVMGIFFIGTAVTNRLAAAFYPARWYGENWMRLRLYVLGSFMLIAFLVSLVVKQL